MRILMISDVYFPRVNGVSTSIQTFRRELSELGHETTLVAPAYRRLTPTSLALCGSRRDTCRSIPRTE